ncbi:hypothetical protein Bhyg_12442 [Pseudolycoriella hygida]|uniref:MARVEL domain-containing protein n=1 Tax=Pseudolycoriella hygida TaxID=35572 RepID=A0A9Q0MYX6_9DIPT|nr:hypothetical protein Bhyg_12442 [Pseudolycoriella hygida]
MARYITIMHAAQITISIASLMIYYTMEKLDYEYQYNVMFFLSYTGCTVGLMAVLMVDSVRFSDMWEQNENDLLIFARLEIIFDIIASIMYATCGSITLTHDIRVENLLSGTFDLINSACFLLDALIFVFCQYRWGTEISVDCERHDLCEKQSR